MELSNIIIYMVYDFYQNHDDNPNCSLHFKDKVKVDIIRVKLL